MLDLLHVMAQRPVIAVLAILGALFVSAGPLMAGGNSKGPSPSIVRYLTVTGYILTIASITLFIVAGFLSGR